MSRSRRDRAAAVLARPGVRKLARRLPRWRGVVTLNYHRIGDSAGQPWDRTLWNADAETFDRQLATLAQHADVVTPEEIPRLLRDNRPGRRVLLTFDDGYRDNYEIAFPLLRRHRLCATFFLATDFLDRARAAWWDELAWMVRGATSTAIPGGEWLPDSLPLGPEENMTISTLIGRYKTLPGKDAERFLEYVAGATGAGRCDPAASANLWMTWDMARELQTLEAGNGDWRAHRHPSDPRARAARPAGGRDRRLQAAAPARAGPGDGLVRLSRRRPRYVQQTWIPSGSCATMAYSSHSASMAGSGASRDGIRSTCRASTCGARPRAGAAAGDGVAATAVRALVSCPSRYRVPMWVAASLRVATR